MHIVTVILKSTPQMLQFHFEHFKDADAVLKKHEQKKTTLELEDDYGSKARIENEQIAGVFITDLSREFEASEIVERAKLKRDANIVRKRQSDPATRIVIPQGYWAN